MRLAPLLLVVAVGTTSVASAQTQALAVDPANPMNVLAGTNSGIYRSVNGGTSFSRELNNVSTYGVAFGAPGSNRAHAAVASRGAYYSTNGGDSWSQSNGANNQQGRCVAAHPTDPMLVYLGTQGALYRSQNGGASYQVLSSSVTNVQALGVARHTPSTIFAGTQGNGLWRSLNAGANWTRLTGTGLTTNATVRAIAIDPYDDDVVYVAREGTGVLRSTDGGATWTLRTTGITNLNVLALAIDPALPDRIYAGTTSGLFVTTNAGQTWSAVNGIPSGQVYAVVVSSEGVVTGQNSVPPTIPGPLAGVTKRITSGNWSVSSNWTPAGVPSASDSVLVLGNATLNTSTTVRRLQVRSGGALTWSGARTLTVTQDTQVLGALNVTSSGAVFVAQGPITVSSGGLLDLASSAQVQLSVGRPSLAVSGTLRSTSTGATLRRIGASGAVDVRVEPGGALDLDGLQVLHGDVEGLHVRQGATITRLRRVSFDQLAGGAGARFLTVEATSLHVSAPGCTFGALSAGQSNALLVDTNGGTTDDVTLTLEDRGAAISGAGAGEARDAEQGGATVNWVWACPDTTAGEAVGAPSVAWDLNTGDLYATYVVFRDVDAARADRVHVFDPDGDGVDRGYWFEVPQAQGDLVGGVWWDTAPTGQHVLWGTTTTGYAFLWVDPGAGAGRINPAPGWPVRFVDSFSSPPVSDRTNVYAAGRLSGTPFIGGIDRQSLTLVWAAFLPYDVRTALATELADGVNYVFAGTPRSAGGSGRGRVYRVNTQAQSVDLTNSDATDAVTAYPYVVSGAGLFVGDLAGRLHGLDQSTFARKPGFPVQVSSAGIEAGVFLDFITDDRVYVADLQGRLWVVAPNGTLVPGWGIAPMGSAPIRAAPLVDAGVLWAANTEGRVVAIDASTRSTLGQWRFGAGARASDLAQEFTAGRTMISTSRGRFYVVATIADPTP